MTTKTTRGLLVVSPQTLLFHPSPQKTRVFGGGTEGRKKKMDSHLRAREERFQNKIKRNAPSRRVFRRDNSRAGKGWALQCKHNFANKCVYDVFVSFFLLMVFPRNLYQTNRIFDLWEKKELFWGEKEKKNCSLKTTLLDTRRNLMLAFTCFEISGASKGDEWRKPKNEDVSREEKKSFCFWKRATALLGFLVVVFLFLLY